MSKVVKRGYVPTDAKEFSSENLELVKRAQADIFMLIERGYKIKNASTFVGNHYLLSERQRLAIVRSTSSLRCMDGTIRDLAGLRGTYKLIDKTDIAIDLIGEKLKEMKIGEVNFYLDSPVSNTGKLKQRILELLAKYSYEVKVELVNNADVILETKSCVITSDAIILNKCESWINLAYDIICEKLPKLKHIDLSMR